MPNRGAVEAFSLALASRSDDYLYRFRVDRECFHHLRRTLSSALGQSRDGVARCCHRHIAYWCLAISMDL